MKNINMETVAMKANIYLIKRLGSKIVLCDRTLTTKQTEHAGLPFLPLISNKEEGNGN